MAKFNGFFSRKKKKEARKREKKTLRERLGRLWSLAKLFLVLAICSWIALAYYGHKVDRLIAEKFDRPRKWDLPSRVYSDSEYLFAGVNIDARGTVQKLDRLGYRNTGDSIKGPGDYARTKDSLYVYLRDFDYPGEKFLGFPVKIDAPGGTITSISNA